MHRQVDNERNASALNLCACGVETRAETALALNNRLQRFCQRGTADRRGAKLTMRRTQIITGGDAALASRRVTQNNDASFTVVCHRHLQMGRS